VAQAFFDVVRKDSRFDAYSPASGQRVGRFSPEGVIPWRPEEEIPPEKFSRRKPRRHVPVGYVNSKDDASLIYDESLRYERELKTSIVSTCLEVLWNCPEPDLGPAVVAVNVKLRGFNKWQQMSYSLKESAIRYVLG
jgi:hypothetical protein